MMNTMTCGEGLKLLCPDGFHIMDDEEQKQLNFYNDSPGQCLSDPERHILISVGYKQINVLTALLVNAKEAAKNAEESISKPMQNYGYHLNGFAEKNVGGEKAYGFGYEYESKGIAMYAESYVIKHDNGLYYLNFYARKELLDESMAVWGEVLESATW